MNTKELLVYRPRPSTVANLCAGCLADKHNDDCRRGIGCLRVVQDRPSDYVCKCDLRARRVSLYSDERIDGAPLARRAAR